jgi:hypothetical protein
MIGHLHILIIVALSDITSWSAIVSPGLNNITVYFDAAYSQATMQIGSSVWFIVSNKDMDKFEELCRSLGREPQYENSFLSVDDMSRANFPIYVAEQKTGDLVLIPSLSYHQVVNLVCQLF